MLLYMCVGVCVVVWVVVVIGWCIVLIDFCEYEVDGW